MKETIEKLDNIGVAIRVFMLNWLILILILKLENLVVNP